MADKYRQGSYAALSTGLIVATSLSGAMVAFNSTLQAQDAPVAPAIAPFRMEASDLPAEGYVAPFQLTAADVAPPSQTTSYSGNQSAGDAALTNNEGDVVEFRDASSAANATIVNNSGGATRFGDDATGGSAFITNNSGSSVAFNDRSTAGGSNITNNAGGVVTFNGDASGGNAAIANNGALEFAGNASATNANIISNEGASIRFAGRSSAGTAQIANNGGIRFEDDASAGQSLLTNNEGATIAFVDRSSALTAAITNNGALRFTGNSTAADSSVVNNRTGAVTFSDTSSAGSSFIANSGRLDFQGASSGQTAEIVNNATGVVALTDQARLGSAMVNNAGTLEFSGASSGDGATIVTAPSGRTLFRDRSTGGLASLQADAGGIVDFSGVTTGQASAGSISGPGTFYLGGVSLSVGGNGQSTTVDGAIVDGGVAGGSGGGLVKLGAGTLTLSGANGYTGMTRVAAGVLQAGRANTFSTSSAFVVDTGSVLALAGFEQAVGSLAGGGAVDLATATLTAGGDNRNTVFDGEIGGTGGLVKAGSGILELGGVSSYTGPTEVRAGELRVLGSIAPSALSVLGGGRLSGNGTVGSTALAGVLSRRSDGGTLTVQGDLTFAQGSIYSIALDSGAGPGLVSVAGNASLGGASLVVSPSGAVSLDGTRYVILSATSIAGTFDTASSDRPFVDLDVFYGADEVSLALTRNGLAFASVARTPNQIATAAGLESVGGGDAYAAVVGVTDEAAALDAFDALSGEIHQTLAARLAGDLSVGRDIVLGEANRSAKMANAARFWLAPFGSAQTAKSDGNAEGYDWRQAGVMLGGDVDVGAGWLAGAAGGYSDGDLEAGAAVESLMLGAYAAGDIAALRAVAGALYGHYSIDTERSVAIGAFRDRASASYDARSAQAFAELSYPVKLASVDWEPFANAAYTWLETDAWSETGGDAALSGTDAETKGGVFTVGLRASRQVMLAQGSSAYFRGTVGWRHSALGENGSVRFAGGAPFFIGGLPVDENTLLAGLEARFAFGNASLGLSYNAEIGELNRQHRVDGSLRVRF